MDRYNLKNNKLAQKINEFFKTHSPEEIYQSLEEAKSKRFNETKVVCAQVTPFLDSNGKEIFVGDYILEKKHGGISTAKRLLVCF